MGAKETRDAIRSQQRSGISTNQEFTPIATDMFLPNYSGVPTTTFPTLKAVTLTAENAIIGGVNSPRPLDLNLADGGNTIILDLQSFKDGGRSEINFRDEDGNNIARIGAHEVDEPGGEAHFHIKTSNAAKTFLPTMFGITTNTDSPIGKFRCQLAVSQTIPSQVAVQITQPEEANALNINNDSTAGYSIEIDQDSNSASDIYALKIVNDNAGAGAPGGIDFSSFSVDEPLLKVPDIGSIVIDVGGSRKYVVWQDTDAVVVTASGVYTPTLTGVANVAASTAYECQYMRVGNTVTVSGKFDIDPTLTTTATQLGISLPIASNFGAVEDCAGTAFASGIAGLGAALLADATNNRAEVNYISTDITNQSMYFTFTYQII